MDNRNGKCESCGAVYQIPASFAHDTARCQVCKGVVHIEPAAEQEPAPEPAPAPPPVAAVEPVQPRLQKGQGSTLARLREQRAKEAAAKQAAPAPVARPAAGAKPKPVVKPAGVKPAAAKAANPKGPRAPRSTVKSTRAGGAGKSAARRSGGGRKRESAGKEKKKSKLPMFAGFGALLLLAGGVYFFKDTLFGGGEDANEVAAAAPEKTMDEGSEAMPAELDDMTVGEEDALADGAQLAADEASDEMPDETEPESNPFDEAAEAKQAKQVDVNSVDLDAIPDFGPVDDTTEEEWTQMNEWMASWMDVDAGASGARAKKKLLDMKRAAFPVILNHFKTLDLGTPDGKSNGDQCQNGLKDICNGTNFGWKYELTAEDVLFNKKVIKLWAGQWQSAENNMLYWIKMAKLDEREPEEAKRLREYAGLDAPAGGAAREDDFGDDLDID